jgi:hypothetical protein
VDSDLLATSPPGAHKHGLTQSNKLEDRTVAQLVVVANRRAGRPTSPIDAASILGYQEPSGTRWRDRHHRRGG